VSAHDIKLAIRLRFDRGLRKGFAMATSVTIYTFGNITIYDIMSGAGACSREDAQAIDDIIGGANPVSMSGYPADFNPCYNVLADIFVLAEQGCEFEVVAVEPDPDYYLGDSDDGFILPEHGKPYRGRACGSFRVGTSAN
jgi:hypothetical protein